MRNQCVYNQHNIFKCVKGDLHPNQTEPAGIFSPPPFWGRLGGGSFGMKFLVSLTTGAARRIVQNETCPFRLPPLPSLEFPLSASQDDVQCGMKCAQ